MSGQGPAYRQAGIIHLLPLILVGIIVIVIVFVTLGAQNLQKPTTSSQATPKKATVKLTSEYENPIDKKTQYVNPFSGYKNPFDTLAK